MWSLSADCSEFCTWTAIMSTHNAFPKSTVSACSRPPQAMSHGCITSLASFMHSSSWQQASLFLYIMKCMSVHMYSSLYVWKKKRLILARQRHYTEDWSIFLWFQTHTHTQSLTCVSCFRWTSKNRTSPSCFWPPVFPTRCSLGWALGAALVLVLQPCRELTSTRYT